MEKALRKWQEADPSFKAFMLGVFFLGINSGVLSSAFNNYLHDSFRISAGARGFLEFPRELPGFLLIFIAGLLAALPMRKWAVITSVASAVGVAGLGFLSPGVAAMTVWMLLWSTGGHLFMTVESVMGLRLAREGAQGKRLGQISGMTNLAAIAGGGLVWLLARAAGGMVYKWAFLCAAASAIVSAALFSRMADRNEEPAGGRKRFVLRWKYRHYYLLNVLFGARKQIFLTFAPWVLVTAYGASPSVMAALAVAASVLGVVFRQTLGIIVDRFGERRMFIADSVILLFICAGFVFTRFKPVLYFLFVLDNLMFATRIARTTYLNRISESKADIAPTISMGITMDHAVSMTIPALGGMLWAAFGYKSVFMAASLLSVAGFFTALAVDSGRQAERVAVPVEPPMKD